MAAGTTTAQPRAPHRAGGASADRPRERIGVPAPRDRSRVRWRRPSPAAGGCPRTRPRASRSSAPGTGHPDADGAAGGPGGRTRPLRVRSAADASAPDGGPQRHHTRRRRGAAARERSEAGAARGRTYRCLGPCRPPCRAAHRHPRCARLPLLRLPADTSSRCSFAPSSRAAGEELHQSQASVRKGCAERRPLAHHGRERRRRARAYLEGAFESRSRRGEQRDRLAGVGADVARGEIDEARLGRMPARSSVAAKPARRRPMPPSAANSCTARRPPGRSTRDGSASAAGARKNANVSTTHTCVKPPTSQGNCARIGGHLVDVAVEPRRALAAAAVASAFVRPWRPPCIPSSPRASGCSRRDAPRDRARARTCERCRGSPARQAT